MNIQDIEEKDELLAQIRSFNSQISAYCQHRAMQGMDDRVQQPLVSLLEHMAKHETVLEAMIVSPRGGRNPATPVKYEFRKPSSLACVIDKMTYVVNLTDADMLQIGMLLDGYMQFFYESLGTSVKAAQEGCRMSCQPDNLLIGSKSAH